jgi:serine/threonine protein kinase
MAPSQEAQGHGRSSMLTPDATPWPEGDGATIPLPPNGLDNGPRIGFLVGGRYRVLAPIAHGAHAVVYRAHDERLDRAVALKWYPVVTGPGPQCFALELRVMTDVNHPNLLRLYDAGVVPGVTVSAGWLITELLPSSLRTRLDHGPLASQDTLVLGSSVAAGLAHLHRAGFVHHDVKPANVLLDLVTGAVERDSVRLADFSVTAGPSGPHSYDAVGAGTVRYLSPEQVLGEPVGPASDVYSLGLLMLECLTARPVYPDGDVEGAFTRIDHPPTIPASAPAVWRTVVGRMCDRDPDVRPDAATVARCLAQLRQGAE